MSANTSPLAHHFENLDQQRAAANLGMWIFLATELMVFGGLFAGYAVYRYWYPVGFAVASSRLNVWFGGVNTLVLLTSSLTMALAVYYAQVNRRSALVTCLALTAALGAAFLVIKGFEYYHDYEEGMVPNLAFRDADWKAPADREQPSPPERAAFPRQVEMFLNLYYVMTGLHAVHLIIGIGILTVLAVNASRGRYTTGYWAPVEVGGLYWHFVDVVWIFLLPLLYLVGMPH